MTARPIQRRAFLRAAGLTLAASAIHVHAAPSSDARPNIILILTDQQHQDTIAAAGAKGIVTPGMDKLVGRGVTFEHSHASNPVCGPCRASLLTGRTTSENGVWTNGPGLRKGMGNLGEWLRKKSDYETYYAGKWHLPQYYTDVIPGFTTLTTGLGGQGNLADASTTAAVEGFLMNRRSKTPFFLTVSYMQPHDICEWLRLNINAPDDARYPELTKAYPALPANHTPPAREPKALRSRRDKGEAARGQWDAAHWRYYRWSYLRHVEMVDAQVDRLVNLLDLSGQSKNTVIVFTSDHGEGFGEHQLTRKSIPYNSALKVPLVIAAPTQIPAGRNATELVSSFDFVPTVCDYAGIAPPKSQRGRSLRPILEGRKPEAYPVLVCEVDDDNCRVVRTLRYKYIAYHADENDMLFDLKTDPGETKNLAADPAHRKPLAAMKAHLLAWEAKLDVVENLPHPTAWWRGGK